MQSLILSELASTRVMLAIKPAKDPEEPRRLPSIWDAIYNPNEKLNGKSKKMPLKVYLLIFFPPLTLPCIVWRGRSHILQVNAILKAQAKEWNWCRGLQKETETSSNWWQLYFWSSKENFYRALKQYWFNPLSFPKCLIILDYPKCKWIYSFVLSENQYLLCGGAYFQAHIFNCHIMYQ